MSLPLLYTAASVAIISVTSFVGALVMTRRQSSVSRAMMYLVSFATGAVLGIVFFHLLPEVMESTEPRVGSALVLGGVLLAFCIEKFIHWHHCHVVDHHDEEEGHHAHPMGALIVIGDGIHNFIDGMLIASAFFVSVPLGVATAIGIILHEVPQELSDIALLLHSGFSRGRAILWNTLSSCSAVLGAVVAIVFAQYVEGIEYLLLPIAAGNFLYIATTDLIPELHKETRLSKSLQQLALVVLGIALMSGLASLGHAYGGHGHDHDAETAEEHEVRGDEHDHDGETAEEHEAHGDEGHDDHDGHAEDGESMHVDVPAR